MRGRRPGPSGSPSTAPWRDERCCHKRPHDPQTPGGAWRGQPVTRRTPQRRPEARRLLSPWTYGRSRLQCRSGSGNRMPALAYRGKHDGGTVLRPRPIPESCSFCGARQFKARKLISAPSKPGSAPAVSRSPASSSSPVPPSGRAYSAQARRRVRPLRVGGEMLRVDLPIARR